ncbi:YetF domain-containing protein, partial [Acinetobacter baumannii]
NRRMERMIEGEPTVIARDGRRLEGVLRRELISRADFDAALRQQGGLRIEYVQIALLETTGHITILPRKGT